MTLLAGLVAFTLGLAWIMLREDTGGQTELTIASLMTAVGAFTALVGLGMFAVRAVA